MNLGILILFGNEPREFYPTPLLAGPFVCLPALFCFFSWEAVRERVGPSCGCQALCTMYVGGQGAWHGCMRYARGRFTRWATHLPPGLSSPIASIITHKKSIMDFCRALPGFWLFFGFRQDGKRFPPSCRGTPTPDAHQDCFPLPDAHSR